MFTVNGVQTGTCQSWGVQRPFPGHGQHGHPGVPAPITSSDKAGYG